MSGKLNAINLASSTPAILYTNTKTSPATVTISMCNKNTSTALIRVAIVSGITINDLTDADYIEYELPIASHNVLERTAIVLGLNDSIYVYSNVASVSAVAWGFTG
jgi:hypothetical protein